MVLLAACYTRIGIRGFFSGLSPALTANAFSWGSYFFLYERNKQREMYQVRKGERVKGEGR